MSKSDEFEECPPPDEEGDGGGEGMREVGRGDFFNSAGDANPDNDGSEQ